MQLPPTSGRVGIELAPPEEISVAEEFALTDDPNGRLGIAACSGRCVVTFATSEDNEAGSVVFIYGADDSEYLNSPELEKVAPCVCDRGETQPNGR